MAPKKPGGSRASSEARNFTVVLEDIRAGFSVFGEALHGMREHMEARFEAVASRFDRMDHELGLVKTAVLENSRKLKDHGLEAKNAAVKKTDPDSPVAPIVLGRRSQPSASCAERPC